MQLVEHNENTPAVSRSERTCIACRRKDATDDLVRFVRAPDGKLVADWKRNLPGRGAHLCVSRGCMEKAIEKHLFAKAFRNSVTCSEVSELVAGVTAGLLRRVESQVRTGIAARKIAYGTDQVRHALGDHTAKLVVLAGDFASRSEFENLAASTGTPAYLFGDKTTLGDWVGRNEVGILAVIDAPLAGAIGRCLQRVEAIG